MKFVIAAILILSPAPAMAGMTAVEFATGIGSPYWVTDGNWRGSVGSDGLYFKEYAARAEYSLSRVWGISSTAGWIHELDMGPRLAAPAYYHYPAPTRKVAYLIQSLCINTEELRLQLGSIIYRTNGGFRTTSYPFDGGHRLKTSFSIELGTDDFYLMGGAFNALPLYNESWEMGGGRKFSGIYDHRIFLFRDSFNNNGIGYRGELGVFKMNSLILGISVGVDDNQHERYTFTVGIKSIFGRNALPNPDL
jgi:hypothetical protein